MNSVELDLWREKLEAAMLEHPQHHLDWRLRRDFYLDLGSDVFARRFRGWLAVLAAQHVLPLVMYRLPYEPQPFRELDACIRLLRGMHCVQDIEELKDESYHWRGSGVGRDLLTGEALLNVDIAAFTAYKALLEVDGWLNPFQWAGDVRQGEGYFVMGGTGTHPGERTAEEFTDEQWAHMAAVGDAASCAAVASACSAESITCMPERLQQFWMWWLNDAWRLAEQLAAPSEELYRERETNQDVSLDGHVNDPLDGFPADAKDLPF